MEEELLKCSFCEKKQDEVEKLITANDVYICDKCVQLYTEKVDKYLRRKQKRCSFCGKKEEKAKKLITNPRRNVYICDECLSLCTEIVEKEKILLKVCEKEQKKEMTSDV